jgi:excisionase family DNA binding protein
MSEVITAAEVARELTNAILLCLKYLKQTDSPSMLQSALPFDESFAVAKMLNVNDVAGILQVSRSHAYTLIRRGEIPSIHIGRSIRVRPADLEAYLEANVG